MEWLSTVESGRSSMIGVGAADIELDSTVDDSSINSGSVGSSSQQNRAKGSVKGSRVSELAKVITHRMSMGQGRASGIHRPNSMRQSNASKPRTSLWESDSEIDSTSQPRESAFSDDDDGGAGDIVRRQSLTAERKSTRLSLAAIFTRRLFNRNNDVEGENPTHSSNRMPSTAVASAVDGSIQRTPSSILLTRTPSVVPGYSQQQQGNINPTHSLHRTPSLVPAATIHSQSTTKVLIRRDVIRTMYLTFIIFIDTVLCLCLCLFVSVSVSVFVFVSVYMYVCTCLYV